MLKRGDWKQSDCTPRIPTRGSSACRNPGHRTSPATEPAVDPLHHAFRNPHGNFRAHTSASGRVKEEHTGLPAKNVSDSALGKVPESGKLFGREVALSPRCLLFLQWVWHGGLNTDGRGHCPTVSSGGSGDDQARGVSCAALTRSIFATAPLRSSTPSA
jgi:hypothetical protein